MRKDVAMTGTTYPIQNTRQDVPDRVNRTMATTKKKPGQSKKPTQQMMPMMTKKKVNMSDGPKGKPSGALSAVGAAPIYGQNKSGDVFIYTKGGAGSGSRGHHGSGKPNGGFPEHPRNSILTGSLRNLGGDFAAMARATTPYRVGSAISTYRSARQAGADSYGARQAVYQRQNAITARNTLSGSLLAHNQHRQDHASYYSGRKSYSYSQLQAKSANRVNPLTLSY